jgi:ribosomal protein L16 Arg81 hydroxylase
MNAESLFDLQRLLDPVPLRDFLGSYWERQLLHLQRGQADYFQPLVEGCDLDRLIANARSTPDYTLALIKDGVIAHQVGEGVQRFGRGDALRIDRIDPETVYREHAAGATLRFTRLERHLTPLWRLAGEIERVLNTDVSVNLYLTPPNSQGFAPHIDLHDALVLQVAGSKRWRIGEPTHDLPVERTVRAHRQLFERPFPFAADTASGGSGADGTTGGASPQPPVEREILLQAGDVLYIPRGVPHSAAAQSEPSMHLTVGFTGLTWHELLVHAVTRRLGLERLLRTGLTPGFVTQPAVAQALAARHGELAEAVQRALAPEWLAEAARDLANRYVYSRRLSTYGQMEDLRRLPNLALDSDVEVRPGITARLEPRPDALYFFYSGRVLTLPDRVRGMIEFMLRARRFKVAEIETELGEKSRLLLTKQLITEGFLGFARG